MKSFHTIAVPHSDILEGRLTMDVWAADLWEVFKNRGPDEYKDSSQFYKKTYVTQGLDNLLSIVERRLKGQGGDPVIQIQTPFGGGKTHALIALYHKGFGAKKVVMVGTSMSPTDTLWGMLEQQLTGKVELFKGMVSPGGEAIQNLLAQHQPVLILMDEVLEYVTKAAGVKVEKSTLSAQTFAFLQELTTVAGTLDKVALLLTLPSSVLEHYDEEAERLFTQLSHVVGRVEKIYTPVQESEISQIIRQRLFSRVDRDIAAQVVQSFMNYAEKENLLPPGTELSEYRKRFEASYPFLPEVIDVLYHRWGSFPNFQRTRGVLRLLSLVIHSLKTTAAPYLSLADFNLSNPELIQDLLRHIGPEFGSVAASDITSKTSGAIKTDNGLGDSYKGLKLGSRSATSIFLYSFSGGVENGATLGEIKRAATTLSNPSSVVAEALEKLKDSLFYLQHDGGKYFFTNQPNLNRILVTRMENVGEPQVREAEEDLLRKSLSGKQIKTMLLLSKRPEDVPDGPEIKLVVMMERQDSLVREILERKGSTPRVYRNAVFFLAPLESERAGFHNLLRKKLAYGQILGDGKLKLTDEQMKDARSELKKTEASLNDSLRRYYRLVLIPIKDGFKEMDLGIPTFGDVKSLDGEAYEKLCASKEILDKIAALVIKEKYLKPSEGHVFTELLFQASLKTPGEARVTGREGWEKGISEGVRQGLFGLGELDDGQIKCHFFKKDPVISFSESEILVREEFCKVEEPKPKEEHEKDKKPDEPEDEKVDTGGEGPSKPPIMQEINLKFNLPKGKVSGLQGVLNLLQHHFGSLRVELHAENGQMTKSDYEDKILEAFSQMGVDVD